jgi:toxin ParE1/3/4
MGKLIWSPQSLDDLEGICRYIGRDSERYAKLFGERILALVESIAKHPMLGAMVPEYQREDLRERLLQNYRVVYRARGDLVEIVTVVHAARLLPPL